RLLRGGGVHARAHATALRAVGQRRGGALVGVRLAALAHQLVDRRHVVKSWMKNKAGRKETGPPRSGSLLRVKYHCQTTTAVPFGVPSSLNRTRGAFRGPSFRMWAGHRRARQR